MLQLITAASSSTNAVNFSSARTTKRFPSSRCASAIKVVRPLGSTVATHPQLQPALLRLSAMISQYFTAMDCASFALQTVMTTHFCHLPFCGCSGLVRSRNPTTAGSSGWSAINCFWIRSTSFDCSSDWWITVMTGVATG